MTLLTTVPAAASSPVAGEAEALLADLGRLDERLHALIEQIRAGTDPASDPDVRGLIIEEGDVDRWLGGLGDDPGLAPGVVPPFAPTPGGRLARLGVLFDLDA